MSAKVNVWKLPSCRPDTAKARHYSKLPPERMAGRGATETNDFIWIPISIIEHTSRNIGGHHVVTLPEWFVDKEGL